MVSYLDYVDFLNEKYGLVEFPYREWYLNEEGNWRIRSRNKKGLTVHHIMENTLNNCSDTFKYPLKHECHLPQNLVYCNAFEHLVLHLLIIKEFPRTRSTNAIPLLLYNANKEFPYLEHKEEYEELFEIFNFDNYLKKYKNKEELC